MVIFFALVVPPFQVPDEAAHLFRADQLSYGDLIGTKKDDVSSGGMVESAYIELFRTYLTQIRPTDQMRQEAEAIPLTGQRQFASFLTPVLYGPFMYAPQAFALAVGRTFSMSALHTFYFARCLNGLLATLLGFLALRTARRGRFVMFTMLTMPTALYLMGSLSQDAFLLATSALFMAHASKAITLNSIPSFAKTVGLITLLTAIAWGRPPYIVLGVCFLFEPLSSMRYKEKLWRHWPGPFALILALVLTEMWEKIVSTIRVWPIPIACPSEQSAFLLSHIDYLPDIVLKTIHYYGAPFLGEFFGVLGLLSVMLPRFFYIMAFLGLIAALVLETFQDWPLQIMRRTLIFLALLAGSTIILLAVYLAYTPVGADVVQGIQGRYFIPFIIAFSFVLPSAFKKYRDSLYPLVALLPIVSLTGMIVSVIKVLRFYY